MITPQKLVSETTGAVSYKVRFRYKGKQTSETFKSLKDRPGRPGAETFAKWLHALGAQGALDQLYNSEQEADIPTLDRVAAEHIAHLTDVTDGTRTTYTRLWDRVWAPRLGHLPTNRVGSDDIKKAVIDLSATYSRKSLENQRGLLAGVLGRAVDKGYLPKNPSKGIRLPRGQESEREDMVIITPDEFTGVIGRVPVHYRPFVRFLFGTGCRWGEAVAVTVADVGPTYTDQAGNRFRMIRIRRALKWSPDNNRKIGPTKTRKGNRTIVVGGDMVDDLGAACEGKAGTELVFTAPRGGMILHRTFWSRQWLPAVSHIVPRPKIHDLRHSHASWLLGNGVPIHVVQARLGHEKITTTVDTYSHLLPDAQQMAAHAATLSFTTGPRELD